MPVAGDGGQQMVNVGAGMHKRMGLKEGLRGISKQENCTYTHDYRRCTVGWGLRGPVFEKAAAQPES